MRDENESEVSQEDWTTDWTGSGGRAEARLLWSVTAENERNQNRLPQSNRVPEEAFSHLNLKYFSLSVLWSQKGEALYVFFISKRTFQLQYYQIFTWTELLCGLTEKRKFSSNLHWKLFPWDFSSACKTCSAEIRDEWCLLNPFISSNELSWPSLCHWNPSNGFKFISRK